jgi:hypothetical protein
MLVALFLQKHSDFPQLRRHSHSSYGLGSSKLPLTTNWRITIKFMYSTLCLGISFLQSKLAMTYC